MKVALLTSDTNHRDGLIEYDDGELFHITFHPSYAILQSVGWVELTPDGVMEKQAKQAREDWKKEVTVIPPELLGKIREILYGVKEG